MYCTFKRGSALDRAQGKLDFRPLEIDSNTNQNFLNSIFTANISNWLSLFSGKLKCLLGVGGGGR